MKNQSKGILLAFLLLSVLVATFTTADAASKRTRRVSTKLQKVCKNIREIGRDQYKNNSPVRARAGDNSSGIVRFALNPTIIFVSGNHAKFGSANAYDKNGNMVIRGAQRLGCDARPRGVCFSRYKANEVSANTKKVRAQAVRRSRSPEIFWHVAKNTCVRIPDVGKCYNVKSRGLCDGRTVR